MTSRPRPSTHPYRYVKLFDPTDAAGRAAIATGETMSVFLMRAVSWYLWLRDQRARGARVLVEDRDGLLREVRYPTGG